MNAFVKELLAGIERQELFVPGDRVVVGVSGGPDSMALLHGLVRLSTLSGWRLSLHVAHLNHGIRGAEADADEQFVWEQASALSLPCITERVDVPAEAARRRASLEEAARDCRYAFFERVCLKLDAGVVAVGHHADDNIETILHRLLRGTGLRGLAGMRPSRPLSLQSRVRLVRPMLAMRRERIREFLAAGSLPFRQDSTNDATQATRNRIRHELLPLIESRINPQVGEALLRLADLAGTLEEYLRETAERMLETCVVHRADGEIVLDLAVLARKQRALQTELIRQSLIHVAGEALELNYRHLAAVADLARDAASGKTVHLPAGVHATKSYNKLVIARAERATAGPMAEVALRLPGRTELPEQRLEIEACIEDFDGGSAGNIRDLKPAGEEWLDWDAIAPPLVVRGRRPGDRFRPLGMPAAKKVAEFLLDEKIPTAQRDRLAILCDQEGPLWVIPLRIDQRVRLTERTRRILRLRWMRL